MKEVAKREPGVSWSLASGKPGASATAQRGFHPEARCPGFCPLLSVNRWLQVSLRNCGV